MQATSNVVRKYGAKVAAVPAMLGLGMGQVMAAVPVDVTTALTDAKTDVGTIALGVLLVFVAIFAFKVLKRAF